MKMTGSGGNSSLCRGSHPEELIKYFEAYIMRKIIKYYEQAKKLLTIAFKTYRYALFF
jgi:hypothetical protein